MKTKEEPEKEERIIAVYDERYSTIDDCTLTKIKDWLGFEAPKWCQEIRFNDRELCCIGYVGSGNYRRVVWKDVFGSWGFPTEIR